jgi:hypothetical protein
MKERKVCNFCAGRAFVRTFLEGVSVCVLLGLGIVSEKRYLVRMGMALKVLSVDNGVGCLRGVFPMTRSREVMYGGPRISEVCGEGVELRLVRMGQSMSEVGRHVGESYARGEANYS